MSWFGEEDKARKSDWPIWDYMFGYFPLAWLEEVRVSVTGNKQHNPGQRLHWAREKSTDQLNTALRHLFDYAKAKAAGIIVPRDAKGMAVLAQAVWRLKAQLQLDLEADAKLKASDSSVSVPSPLKSDDIVMSQCSCGAVPFAYHRGDLPPTITTDQGTHSENGCVGP